MQDNVGIVLKVNFFDKRIVLFDRDLGRMQVSMFSRNNLVKSNFTSLCNGAFATYNLDKKNSKISVKNLNIIDVPFQVAHKNILFFHHILEIGYYFVPEGISSSQIFDLIYFALFCFEKIESIRLQKIFLTKFFLSTGFYPEDENMKSYFNYIITIPIDSIADIAIDLKNENDLNQWIARCVNMHPYSKLFKTTGFLNKIIES